MSRASRRAIPATNRRDLFGAASAMLLLGTAAAGPGKAAELDGPLLAAFRAWQPLERERQALCKLDADDPTWEGRWAAFSGEWHDLMEEITDMPARTPEGVQAKATVLRALLHEHGGFAPGREVIGATPSETLAWSLVMDMLGRAGT